MKKYSIWAVALVLVLAVVGCSSSDVLNLIIPDLTGNWSYVMNNSDVATFSNCSGDLAFLEGRTYDEGMAVAPICAELGSFTVFQIQGTATINPTDITCSDGSTAFLAGTITLTDTMADGSWNTTNLLNTSSQSFSGTISGNTIDLQESRLAFTNSLQGSCDLSPPLSSTVTVQ